MSTTFSSRGVDSLEVGVTLAQERVVGPLIAHRADRVGRYSGLVTQIRVALAQRAQHSVSSVITRAPGRRETLKRCLLAP